MAIKAVLLTKTHVFFFCYWELLSLCKLLQKSGPKENAYLFLPPPLHLYKSRFQSLLQKLEIFGKSSSPSDTLLYSDKNFILIPTLGSVSPLWMLFLPKSLFLNFAQVSMNYKIRPIPTIANILSENFGYNKEFIWFEHGATTSGAVPGSNVDHGHIHVILEPNFTFKSFQKKVLSMDNRNWKSVPAETAYDNRNWQKDYLAFGNKNTAFWTNLNSPKISQFFRKAIAELVGRADEWNYRKFPHHEHAKETVSFIEQLKTHRKDKNTP